MDFEGKGRARQRRGRGREKPRGKLGQGELHWTSSWEGILPPVAGVKGLGSADLSSWGRAVNGLIVQRMGWLTPRSGLHGLPVLPSSLGCLV